MTLRPRRSALYVPASNLRAMDKARTLPCDVVILDLEDAVAPEEKGAARDQAVQAVRQGFGQREVVVRVNALSTPEGPKDLKAALAAGPHAILLPKVGGPADVAAACAYGGDTPLWAMIETARAAHHLWAIAGAAPRLAALVLGLNDLAKETGARQTPGREAFFSVMSGAVAAARGHGLAVLDGVHNAIDDAAGLAAACRQGRDFGFDGKTLIHPGQIEAANRAYSPDAQELAQASAIAAAFDLPHNAGKGVLKVDGAMVERLHLAQAQRLLAVQAVLDRRARDLKETTR